MIKLKNLKIKLIRYFSLLIIAIIISISLNSIFFSKESKKFVYEIKILKDFNYIETKEGIFYRLVKNLKKIYAHQSPVDYKKCQEKYLDEPTSLTTDNLIFLCLDENIRYLEFAYNIGYVVINLEKYDEIFDRNIKLSMNETVKEIRTEIKDFVKLVDEFLPSIKENGNFIDYINILKIRNTYELETSKIFDTMIAGKEEKLSYMIINNSIIILINIIIYFFLVLFFLTKKK